MSIDTGIRKRNGWLKVAGIILASITALTAVGAAILGVMPRATADAIHKELKEEDKAIRANMEVKLEKYELKEHAQEVYKRLDAQHQRNFDSIQRGQQMILQEIRKKRN